METFKLKFLAVLSVLWLFLPVMVFAQEEKDESSTALPEEVNSYELFWPLVAGKTEGDSFYFLKLFKEQVQGWFISGDSKKADYAVLLGVKRVLEAEELIKNNKIDLALKAIERADSQFSKAYNHIKTADSKGKLATGEIQRERLINIKILVDYLRTISPEKTHPGLDTVKEKAGMMLSDYLP